MISGFSSATNKLHVCLGCLFIKSPKCKRSRPRHIAFKLRSRFITTSSCIRCCRKCSLFAGVMVLVMHQPLLLRIYALDGLSSNLSISSSLVASLSYMHEISLLHKGGGSQIKILHCRLAILSGTDPDFQRFLRRGA